MARRIYYAVEFNSNRLKRTNTHWRHTRKPLLRASLSHMRASKHKSNLSLSLRNIDRAGCIPGLPALLYRSSPASCSLHEQTPNNRRSRPGACGPRCAFAEIHGLRKRPEYATCRRTRCPTNPITAESNCFRHPATQQDCARQRSCDSVPQNRANF